VESFCKTYVHEEILRPRLYSPDGNKFADKGFISCLAKSWFAGYYSRIFARSYAQNEKKKKNETGANRADLSCVGGRRSAISIFTHTVEFPWDTRDAFRTFPSPFTFAVLGEKQSTSPLDQQSAIDRPCRGRIYRAQFSTLVRSFARSLSDRAYVLARRYESPDAYGCVREPRGLPPTHAPGGTLHRLNIYPSVRRESRRRR